MPESCSRNSPDKSPDETAEQFTMTTAQHAANQRIMLVAIEREYQTHLETESPCSQDKAIMAAVHQDEFTEPINAEDWDAYIYDLAFCLERKLGIYSANQTDA
jgi:hypothetical protein